MWKNHTFFFVSYQGNRAAQPETSGASQGVTTVFTATQRNGVFPGINVDTPSPFPMVGEDGATHPAGTPYSTLFPTGHIPAGDLNPLALKLISAPTCRFPPAAAITLSSPRRRPFKTN